MYVYIYVFINIPTHTLTDKEQSFTRQIVQEPKHDDSGEHLEEPDNRGRILEGVHREQYSMEELVMIEQGAKSDKSVTQLEDGSDEERTILPNSDLGRPESQKSTRSMGISQSAIRELEKNKIETDDNVSF